MSLQLGPDCIGPRQHYPYHCAEPLMGRQTNLCTDNILSSSVVNRCPTLLPLIPTILPPHPPGAAYEMTVVSRGMLILHRCVDSQSLITEPKISGSDADAETRAEDQRIIEAFKEDANGILVFVRL
jgi:hypothetical protein